MGQIKTICIIKILFCEPWKTECFSFYFGVIWVCLLRCRSGGLGFFGFFLDRLSSGGPVLCWTWLTWIETFKLVLIQKLTSHLCWLLHIELPKSGLAFTFCKVLGFTSYVSYLCILVFSSCRLLGAGVAFTVFNVPCTSGVLSSDS